MRPRWLVRLDNAPGDSLARRSAWLVPAVLAAFFTILIAVVLPPSRDLHNIFDWAAMGCV